jgi:hypothetical protein
VIELKQRPLHGDIIFADGQISFITALFIFEFLISSHIGEAALPLLCYKLELEK